MIDLTCLKAYDIRGEIGVSIDEDMVYRIGRATVQHFKSKTVVIGFDADEQFSKIKDFLGMLRSKVFSNCYTTLPKFVPEALGVKAGDMKTFTKEIEWLARLAMVEF